MLVYWIKSPEADSSVILARMSEAFLKYMNVLIHLQF